MAKQYKIKRYKNKWGSSSPGHYTLVAVIFTLVIVGLVFAGIRLYQPVYDYIMGIGVTGAPESEPSPSEPEPEPQSETEASEPEPEPPSTVSGDLRAVYLPPEVFASDEKLNSFLGSVPDDINAVMVDGKDAKGNILYASENPQALEWGAVKDGAPDLAGLALRLHEKDFSLIVRMTAFNDAIAARGDRVGNAIHYQNTETIWLDNSLDRGGKPWLNPYSDKARGYLRSLAVEAAKMGAAMVVFEGVNFPNDVTNSGTFGDTGGLSRSDILAKFVSETTLALETENAALAVYLPYRSIIEPDGIPATRYGGPALDMVSASLALGILPDQLGGTGDELAKNAAAAINEIKSRVDAGVELIPMIQAGGELTKEQSEALLNAVKGSGIREYILYNASGSY